MKKYTLLEIVTSVLDSMGSDAISTVEGATATEESLQIISIAKDLYFYMAAEQDWKYLKTTGVLTSLSDTATPSHMRLPSGMEEVEVIKYDVREAVGDNLSFQEIEYISDPSRFLHILHQRTSTDSTIQTVTDFGGATLLIKNDAPPTYWTTIDDDYVIFDSFDSGIETFLVSAKSVVVGTSEPVWTELDASVPDMPGKMFPHFLSTLKAICHEDIQKEASAWHTKQADKSDRRIAYNNTKTRNPNGLGRTTHYGRK